ncbi:hypothetical protein BASA83_003391 [Batrachochytrium salamandrivorans]|nr:hypothetical protein BASA83_003391 [Batrachochytrium salamandrivorans]
MISLYGLFILLLTAEAIHAQGNKDNGDDANQPSGYKKVTDLPLRVYPLRLTEALQESNTPDQSGASASVDRQPERECKGLRWLRKLSKSCPQQQSQPEPQSSTSYDHPQLNEMPLPAYVRKSEAESYNKIQNAEQYNAFTKIEAKYFKSEYSSKKKLGQGDFGVVRLATRKYDGLKVAYKSIPKSKVYEYALESIPPPRCHLSNTLGHSEEPSVAQCMSSRPPNLLIPYEFALQIYLSRPGYENPYVPMTLDYIILKDKYILVMEYCDRKWTTLSSYVKKKKRLDISETHDIVREVINGMMSLKQHGIVHEDLHAKNVMYNPETRQVKLIDFGQSVILSGWEDGKSSPSRSSNPPSTNSKYKAGADELHSSWTLGELLYTLITGRDLYIDYSDYEKMLRKALFPESDPYKSELKENAVRLIDALDSVDPDQMPSIEAILEDPFFSMK